MKLGRFFKPTYSKLLLVLCGISIGLSPSFEKIYIKLILLIVAIALAIWSDKIKKVEDK
jgi:hypothetical protein